MSILSNVYLFIQSLQSSLKLPGNFSSFGPISQNSRHLHKHTKNSNIVAKLTENGGSNPILYPSMNCDWLTNRQNTVQLRVPFPISKSQIAIHWPTIPIQTNTANKSHN